MGRSDAHTVYGSLTLLVLRILQDGPRHGLSVSREIEARAGDALTIEEGALYPALHRLERDGLVVGSWGMSATSRRRVKTYELTERGRGRLEAERHRWIEHAKAVAAVLDLSPNWNR